MTVLARIDHDGNTLSGYTSTVTAGGDLSTSREAALGGSSHGMSCFIDDTANRYGEYNLVTPSTTGVLRWRFYLDPNSLTIPDNQNFTVALLLNSSVASLARLYLKILSGQYQILPSVYSDNATELFAGSYTTVSDEPHWLEFRLVRSTGTDTNDGYLEWWIDGVKKSGRYSVDNDTVFANFDAIRIGAFNTIDAGTSGTLYLDELIIRDDDVPIGPNPSTNQVGGFRARPTKDFRYPTTICVPNTDSPLFRNLVGWWPLGSPAAGGKIPEPVRGRVATPNGFLAWNADDFGRNYRFLKTDNVILSHSRLTIPHPLTISVWCRATGEGGAFPGLMGSNTATTYYILHDPNSTTWRFSDGSVNKGLSGTINRLTLLTYVMSPTGSAQVYADGVALGAPGSTTMTYHDFDQIGGFWSGYGYNGYIYDVKVFNRDLTPSEVWSLYDPDTRWDLHLPVQPRPFWSFPYTTSKVGYRQRKRDKPPDTNYAINSASWQSRDLVFDLLATKPNDPGPYLRQSTISGDALTRWESGALGKGFKASGGSAYTRAYSTKGTATTRWTACFWITPLAHNSASGGGISMFEFRTALSSARAQSLIHEHWGVDGYVMKIGTQDFNWATNGIPSSIVPIGIPAFMVWTALHDGTNYVMRSYLNGRLYQQNSHTYATSYGAADEQPQFFSAGSSMTSVDVIHNVRYYNRILSDAEIAELYNPDTRWDLYRLPDQVWVNVPSTGYPTAPISWGHVTGVAESTVRTFASNWTGTGEIQNSGDSERLAMDATEYMEGEIVDTGAVTVAIRYNYYAAGDTVTVKYRHGATPAACEAASWNTYSGSFTSLGYVQVRLEA